jgi:hypothetical protein
MVTLQLKQLSVPAGQRIILTDINWSKFEDILPELGEKRATPFPPQDYVLTAIAKHCLGRSIAITGFQQIKFIVAIQP